MKLWGGRFKKDTDQLMETFSASIAFDQRLWPYDIFGSITHVHGLEKAGLVTAAEATLLKQGLESLQTKLQKNQIQFNIADEDIHMNIERLLTAEIGSVALKLHTGRSRNDQVALDLHLYVRDQVIVSVEKILHLQNSLLNQATAHVDTLLPGMTHLQHAQPVRLAHHLLAYVHMLQRDSERLMMSFTHINQSPLGSGAIAGSGFKIDQGYLAELMHFESYYLNSMDAVSDRDFVAEFLAHSSLIMMHLSRLSEELILWSSQEFSFIELDDAFTTGSSMMPQKKNPDVAELVRGKTGRVYGALMSVLTMLKGLPLAYNKDLQEDKECLFDSVDTIQQSLSIFAAMIDSMTINKERMQHALMTSYSTATTLADYLVKKGVPFREAHAVIGRLIGFCLSGQRLLSDLSLLEFNTFSNYFADDVFPLLQPENAIETIGVANGTSKTGVTNQIKALQKKLTDTKQWVDRHNALRIVIE